LVVSFNLELEYQTIICQEQVHVLSKKKASKPPEIFFGANQHEAVSIFESTFERFKFCCHGDEMLGNFWIDVGGFDLV
jgi:hypothetical protein